MKTAGYSLLAQTFCFPESMALIDTICFLLRGFVDIDPHLQRLSKPPQTRADPESSCCVVSGTPPHDGTQRQVLSADYYVKYHYGILVQISMQEL